MFSPIFHVINLTKEFSVGNNIFLSVATIAVKILASTHAEIANKASRKSYSVCTVVNLSFFPLIKLSLQNHLCFPCRKDLAMLSLVKKHCTFQC